MEKINVEVELTCTCSVCGESVECYIDKGFMQVDPCETCLGKAHKDGMEEARDLYEEENE